MSRFRPAGVRNGRTASLRALRPVSGRPARRRTPHLAMGGTASRRRALTEPGCASERGLAMGGGRPAERRFTVGGSGKSVARCHRTVLAYWKFESISLQQTVRLSPDFAFVPRKARVLRRCGDVAGQYGRQRRERSSNIALRSGSVSIGRYFSTAASPMRFAPVGAAAPSAGCAARDSAISIKLRAGIGSSKAEHSPLIVPSQRQTRLYQQLVRSQPARLAPIENGSRDVRGEIAEADKPREIGWADAFLLGQCGKRYAVAAGEGGIEPARPDQ